MREMWSGQQGRLLPVEEPGAELGEVTLGGDPAGVVLGGERRSIPVYGPGGYAWRPSVGDQVLVLKAGAERESPCIVGRVQGDLNLGPGETAVSGGDSAVYLKTGQLDLRGNVTINGVGLVDLIAAVVAEILSNLEV
ncbi:hypothetical protein [Flavonifractor sp. An100]|uniref:hypothetical protein n=1 Tax=Flavonifractor sp. An100 TaxID=1965538 RepID=UPI00117AE783|nr:hypothetical protein [Flavonifractor sp. An100]